MFDQLLLLAKGQTVYCGRMDKAVQYFEDIGHACPPGYNLADHLIDLTAEAGDSTPSQEIPSEVINESYRDEEAGIGSSNTNPNAGAGAATSGSEDTELRTRPNSIVDGNGNSGVRLRTKTSRLAQNLRYAFSKGQHRSLLGVVTPPKLAVLLDAYKASPISKEIKEEIDAFGSGNGSGTASANGNPSVMGNFEILGSYKKASLWTQFTILSGRAFKNLYRNPMLMLAHYAMAVVTACKSKLLLHLPLLARVSSTNLSFHSSPVFCGLLYHDLSLDIAGFQNRLGLFFFILTLFGLSTLTSLGVFANERALFVRERANGYYSPLTYFTSKLMFDILPLRVIPPFLLGGIVYFLVGLVPGVAEFWKVSSCMGNKERFHHRTYRLLFVSFPSPVHLVSCCCQRVKLLDFSELPSLTLALSFPSTSRTLVLFSLAASSAVFFISIAISDTGVANLVGSLTSKSKLHYLQNYKT